MNVHLVDQSLEALDQAKDQIEDSTIRLLKKQFPNDKQVAFTLD
jgi:hypothetical protein